MNFAATVISMKKLNTKTVVKIKSCHSGVTKRVCENHRHAILYCKKCGAKLGEYDLIYESHESHALCGNCVDEYKKEVPIVLNDNVTVTKDCGSFVKVFYKDTMQYELKQCYFTRKGRYFNYHGKRLYV